MREFLNFIRPDKFAIIKDKKKDILIFKNINIKDKLIFFNKNFKFIQNSEEQSIIQSCGSYFIEINKHFNWYRIINKFGIPNKIIKTKLNIKIEDLKIDQIRKEIIVLDAKSNLLYFKINNKKIIFKKKIKLNITYDLAKFDFYDHKKLVLCVDNKKLLFFEDFKIKFKKKITGIRLISSLKIFFNKIILVDQLNYCLHIFNSNGKKIKKIGSKGIDIGNFDLPKEISSIGKKLLISDQNNDRFLIINRYLKIKIYEKRFKTQKNLSRPIKSLIIKKLIYILDRENNRIQVYNSKLIFVKSYKLKKVKNSKPNSFCFNTKLNCFFVLYRRSNLKNFLIKYDYKFKKKIFKEISTLDSQDLSCSQNYLFLANTLGRTIEKYDLNINFVKKVNLNILSSNPRVLSKTVCLDKYEKIYTATFDDFKLFKFDENLNLLKTINLKKYADELKVIRAIFINIHDQDIVYILNRGKYPIWVYSIQKNKVIKKVNIIKNRIYLKNPTSISMFDKNLIICDKENDRILKKNISYFQ
tara:strand:+ start:8502 stop:10082 length:1581 start_codon:yes stop_codon:yes gene_type:complete